MKIPIRKSIFEKPRWLNGPIICVFENLPAFDSLKTLSDFYSRLGSVVIGAKWKCPRCEHYHAKVIGSTTASASGTMKVLPEYKTQAEKQGYKLEECV